MLSRLGLSADRPWLIWILLLASGQAADLATTRVDISRGALEANATVAHLLHTGGFPLVLLVKLSMVVAMSLIVLMVHRYTGSEPGARGRTARTIVWRGLQLCVVVLTVTALHNVVVLAQLQGWPAPNILTALPSLNA